MLYVDLDIGGHQIDLVLAPDTKSTRLGGDVIPQTGTPRYGRITCRERARFAQGAAPVEAQTINRRFPQEETRRLLVDAEAHGLPHTLAALFLRLLWRIARIAAAEPLRAHNRLLVLVIRHNL